MFQIYSTVAIVLLSRTIISLAMLNFVWTISQPHAIIMAVAYMIQMLSESNLQRLMTKGDNNDS